MSRLTYGLLFYALPFCIILAAELYAVFSHKGVTITYILTTYIPLVWLIAITAFWAVWCEVHWAQTDAHNRRLQIAKQARREMKAVR